MRDILCHDYITQFSNNINFEWRKSCNNCNTRKPGFEGETEDERRSRIYGNRKDNQSYNSEYNRDRSRSYERDGGSHRGGGQGPDRSQGRDWENRDRPKRPYKGWKNTKYIA